MLMGMFSRRPTRTPEPEFEDGEADDAWLNTGYSRWNRDSAAHRGSPGMLAMAGEKALRRNDLAKAAFFYADAIDRINTWSSPSISTDWKPSDQDLEIIDRYIDLVEQIHLEHPNADIADRGRNCNATYTAQMIVGIIRRVSNPGPFNQRLDRLVEVAAIKPWW